MNRNKLSRRTLLLGGVAGILSACSTSASSTSVPAATAEPKPTEFPSAQPTNVMSAMPDTGRAPSKDFVPDVELALTATRAEVPLMAGKPTRVFTYQAQVLKGPAESAVALPNSPLAR